jgi:hypothetical protein
MFKLKEVERIDNFNLEEEEACKKYLQVQNEGNRKVARNGN